MPTDEERTSVTSALRRRARRVLQQERRSSSATLPTDAPADEAMVQLLGEDAARMMFAAGICDYHALAMRTISFAERYARVFDDRVTTPLAALDARRQEAVIPSRARFDAVVTMAGRVLQEACGCAPQGEPLREADATEALRQRTAIRDVEDAHIAESLGRRGEANGGLGSAPQSAQVEEAISAAAEAVEVFGEDELEHFAAEHPPVRRAAPPRALPGRGLTAGQRIAKRLREGGSALDTAAHQQGVGAPNTDRSQSSAGLLSAADAADKRARSEGTSL